MDTNMAENPLLHGTGGWGFLPYLPPYVFTIFWGVRQKYEGKYGGLALEIMGLNFNLVCG
jgi:hypothetical protein